MLKNICVLAKSAGDAVMNIYSNNNMNYYIYHKFDKSPVTVADIISHNIIIKGLNNILPKIPILSEENLYPWEIRKNWENYWLVDPLDGTKEFIKHNNEFTINIALIKQGNPILGVVYAPALKTMYYADVLKRKAWKEKNNRIEQIHSCCIYPPSVLISRSHNLNNINEMNKFLLSFNNYRIIEIGSSLKFCLIAEGKAQFYPRFNPTSIWDTGAGHAIILASGAYIKDLQGVTLNYLPKKSLINPKFLVSV
ncbi:3'(2'),5'-bisphosphate nucleotidase [Candidatus Pantoea edessiphila]|uniref:3'(2'),5'-bisphosphate nucleotidase CysQ n=1 Tax=Candidatus Pantoea edessiphila TaxID=2044610 RepID=A0A2P5T1V3_9GAMM|nr:3'(2'),5'-bisphosphate nucleotidase CysQ [Candidatus Pantoea edessiphila]PPI88571.1 3'(2'),5'-bisphosphate nucleotidase [Candidatus Pantoea edessiphila]